MRLESEAEDLRLKLKILDKDMVSMRKIERRKTPPFVSLPHILSLV